MSEKGKAPTGAATSAGAAETAAFGGAATSCNYSTTGGTGRQPGFVESLLMYGAESGLTITDLERLTGQRSREIRRQIEQERRAGALIISDCRRGYWLTHDPAEVQLFVRSMRHRAREILKTARAIEGAAWLD